MEKTIYCTEWMTKRERDNDCPEYHVANDEEIEMLDKDEHDDLFSMGDAELHDYEIDPLNSCREIPVSKLYKIVEEE